MCNKFIDISENNTILSYNGIIQSNLKGVIMKATEGTTYKDGMVELSYDALNGQTNIGFYHYLTSTSDPKTQAQAFWDKIKDKEYQILPVLDVEQESLSRLAEEYTQSFLQEFFSLSGQNMIIYSGRCYIEANFTDSFKRSQIWWVADYSANECPTLTGCEVIAWQYSEDEKSYAFCMGNLDCSILEDETKFFITNQLPFAETTTPIESESTITYLQTELNKQGFKDKNGNSLQVDGVSGELTLSACPTLKEGATGLITQWVQIKVGCASDGAYGEETRQAVIVYQENMSLDGDGVVGQNTWRKLLGM